MMYAVSLGSNFQHEQAFAQAKIALAQLGVCQFSRCFELPDRNNPAARFWNMAAVINSPIDCMAAFEAQLHHIEHDCGRQRPSAQVRLDLDLIATGADLSSLVILPKRLPLTVDVQMPLQTLVPNWSNLQH